SHLVISPQPCCTAKHNAISGVKNFLLFLELLYPGQPVVLVALVNKLYVDPSLTRLVIDRFEEGHDNPMTHSRHTNLFLCFQEFQNDSRTSVCLTRARRSPSGQNASVKTQRDPARRSNPVFALFYGDALLFINKSRFALHQQLFRGKVVAHWR